MVTVRQHVLSGDGAGGRGRPLRASAAAARQGPGREGHPEAESPGRRGAAVPSPSRRRSQVCTNYNYSNTTNKSFSFLSSDDSPNIRQLGIWQILTFGKFDALSFMVNF